MQSITKYKAVDNRKFNSEAECAAHEAYLLQVQACDDMLPRAIDPYCNYANGAGFVQHTFEAVEAYRFRVAEIIEQRLGDRKYRDDFLKNGTFSFTGRVASDTCDYLWGLIGRAGCIDSRCREWGQAYYAIHAASQPAFEWLDVGKKPIY